jgi:hypothetical protein
VTLSIVHQSAIVADPPPRSLWVHSFRSSDSGKQGTCICLFILHNAQGRKLRIRSRLTQHSRVISSPWWHGKKWRDTFPYRQQFAPFRVGPELLRMTLPPVKFEWADPLYSGPCPRDKGLGDFCITDLTNASYLPSLLLIFFSHALIVLQLAIAVNRGIRTSQSKGCLVLGNERSESEPRVNS